MKKILIFMMILAVAGSAAAAKKKKAEKQVEVAPKGLETTVSVGLTLTDGNSDTLSANGTITTEGEKEGLGSILAGVEANYGESDVNDVNEKTVDNAKIYGSLKKTLSPMTYASLDGTALYDDIALIDYRVNLGPSVGAYLVKNDMREFSVDVGPSYLWEEVDSVTDHYLAIRIGERFTCQISETAKLWQSAEYLPKAEDFDQYLLNVEIGIEASVSELISLRVVLQDKYNSMPAVDTEHNDLTLIAGLGFTL